MNIAYKVFTCAQLPPPNLCLGGPPIYCTDCLTPNGTGGYVQSDGTKWRLFNGLEATTDARVYGLSFHQSSLRNINGPLDEGVNYSPGPAAISVFGSVTATGTGASGATSYNVTPSTDQPYLTASGSLTGTTTTGGGSGGILLTQGAKYRGGMVWLYCAADVFIPVASTAAEEFACHFGWLNVTNPAAAFATFLDDACIGFVYDRANVSGVNPTNNENWWAVSRNASTNTPIDTGVAVNKSTSTRQRLELLVAASAAYFYIEGVLVATIDTNLPATTNKTWDQWKILKSAGTTGRYFVFTRKTRLVRKTLAT